MSHNKLNSTNRNLEPTHCVLTFAAWTCHGPGSPKLEYLYLLKTNGAFLVNRQASYVFQPRNHAWSRLRWPIMPGTDFIRLCLNFRTGHRLVFSVHSVSLWLILVHHENDTFGASAI